jgi:hypothetical protein
VFAAIGLASKAAAAAELVQVAAIANLASTWTNHRVFTGEQGR